GYGYQTFNSYYSPFTGTTYGQSYYTDVFGQAMTRSYGYNPWTGMGYRTGFYQPNYYLYPNGGDSFGGTYPPPRWGWGWVGRTPWSKARRPGDPPVAARVWG